MGKAELQDQMADLKRLLHECRQAPLYAQPDIARRLLGRAINILDELIARLPDGEQ